MGELGGSIIIMKKRYIKPAIEVIAQRYGEGLMKNESFGFSGPATGGGDAKPGGEWGYDGWAEPVDNNGDDWAI